MKVIDCLLIQFNQLVQWLTHMSSTTRRRKKLTGKCRQFAAKRTMHFIRQGSAETWFQCSPLYHKYDQCDIGFTDCFLVLWTFLKSLTSRLQIVCLFDIITQDIGRSMMFIARRNISSWYSCRVSAVAAAETLAPPSDESSRQSSNIGYRARKTDSSNCYIASNSTSTDQQQL